MWKATEQFYFFTICQHCMKVEKGKERNGHLGWKSESLLCIKEKKNVRWVKDWGNLIKNNVGHSRLTLFFILH